VDQFSPERAKPRIGAPVAEGSVIAQAIPDWCPAGCLDHACLHRRLVDESQPFQGVAHEGLAAGDPDASREGDIGALLLSRVQVFFCD
jgi:hypothetical protein